MPRHSQQSPPHSCDGHEHDGLLAWNSNALEQHDAAAPHLHNASNVDINCPSYAGSESDKPERQLHSRHYQRETSSRRNKQACWREPCPVSQSNLPRRQLTQYITCHPPSHLHFLLHAAFFQLLLWVTSLPILLFYSALFNSLP